MVSLLGDYYYEFPTPMPLKLRLKDMLEKEVDEKYYLSDDAVNKILNSDFNQEHGRIQSGGGCVKRFAQEITRGHRV